MPFDLLIRNASELLTLTGDVRRGADAALAPLPDGVLGVTAGRISFVGSSAALPEEAVGPTTRVIDASGGFVGPGFVDPHTHLVFAGDRSNEFDLRCRGKSYVEIAQAGGGIMSTVRATRAASEDELCALARPRLRRLLEVGITCAEVKSGYGLNIDDELKMLRVVRRLGMEQPVELVPTLLCAHAIPSELRESRERYVALCIDEIVPRVAEAGLARFCDAFAEESAFTVDECRRILRAASDHGLRPRLHADQLTASGGASLASELGAATADHLEHVSAEGIAAMAGAGVSAVLVPTSTLFLRQRGYAPGRRLWDAGVNVALGTNLNPGSAMSENLPLALSLACLENGLSPAEAYYAATRGGALALGESSLGQLCVGAPADVVVFDCASYRHLPYHLAANHARFVVKRGQVVVERRPALEKPCA